MERCKELIMKFKVLFLAALVVVFAALSGTTAALQNDSSPETQPAKVVKVGDLNSDGKVDIQDLSILLTSWQNETTDGDLNSDSTVNIFDLSILLSNYDHADKD
jgi:hypothetical protein